MVLFEILKAAAIFLALLVPLILIHEFGHFLVAKAFGIKVLEFGVGFPPRIKGLVWRRGETEYTVNALPIGGFVRLLGEEDPSDPRSLAAAARWKRLTVMAAGVFMNLVLAIFLFSLVFMIPRDRDLSLAMVSEVAPGSPAAEAVVEGEMRDGTAPLQGVQPGDIVVDVEGRDIKNTQELIYTTRLHLGETQEWTIHRAGSTLTAHVYARWHPPADQGPTGIQIGAPTTCLAFDDEGECSDARLIYPNTENVWYWPWEALPKGLGALRDTVVLTANEIRVRVGGGGGGGVPDDSAAVSGPVGVADQTSDLVEAAGWRAAIELGALLSLNLAVFNALPIPGLDGGRMLFLFIEIIRGGRRIAPQKEALVHLAGFALLFASIIVVTYFDIARIAS